MSAASGGGAPPPMPCREVFDENSQPSVEEISDYAQQIGIDPVSEGHLLPLAKDGLMQALPSPWKAYYDDKLKAHYFYNTETKVTQWDHPLDQVYKTLVVKARQASERGDSILDDTCVSIQDLLTYEEDPKEILGDKIKENLQSINGDSSIDNSLEEELSASKNNAKKIQKPGMNTAMGFKKNFPTLTPIMGFGKMAGESNTFPRTAQLGLNRFKNVNYEDILNPNEKSNRPESHIKTVPSLNKPVGKFSKQPSDIIDLSFNPNKPDENLSSDEYYNKSAPKKGLTLSGGGSVFLKSNRTVTSVQHSVEVSNRSSISSENPKSILRDRNFGDLYFKPPSFEKNDVKINDEEDKKSVRFNLEDKNVDFQYDYSPSPSSNSSSDLLMGGNQNSIIQSDVKHLETFGKGKAMMRRNSDNSILLTDIPNFAKNSKLKPLNHDDAKPFGKEQVKSKDDSGSISNSPTRKLIKPNPGDFIKPNLFQKPFEKLSDILKSGSPDSESESEQKPINSSPPPPLKRKLSINLLESVDSEASIDSPDKEAVNIVQEMPKGQTLVNSDVKGKKANARGVPMKPIGKMLPVGEDDVLDDLRMFKNELANKKSEELNEIKVRFEHELKQTKASLEENYKSKLDSLRESLKREHARNESDVKKAITEAQNRHDGEISRALENLKLEHIDRKEKALEDERNKLAEDLQESIRLLNNEHLKEIEKLRQEKRNQLQIMSQNLEQENLKSLNEQRLQYADNFEAEKIRLIADNKSALDKMKIEHEAMCDELRKDYRSEVELVRGQQAAHLSSLREKLRREREPPRPPAALSPPSAGASPRDDTSYERLRCDKRLLEDKYRCLKEKYARLKSDVKISIERRNKRREQSVTTGSETERSHSHKTLPSTDKSGDGGEANKDQMSRTGKRLVLINNNSGYHSKSCNNNDPNQAPKENGTENNNSKIENSIDNRSTEDSVPHQNSNLLTISGKSGNHISPDRLKAKSNLREKSPVGRITRHERQKSFNGDNESSIGMNDISLSQSDSHPVSNKYSKKVNIVEHHKEKIREAGEIRMKSALRKVPRHDNGYADTTVTDYHDSSDTGASEKHNNESLTGRHRKKLFTRLKSASTSRLNYSISSKLNERACSPVENLRQQLRKLEDLEEQFPDVSLNADTTAYRLRYPFPDSGSGGGVSGGELGFLRHRALVEREGVRRARAVLRRRTDLLKQRRRSPAAWQEECELTDMEVSLHRTKSILGEKVIRLRHIEKSLRKLQGNQENKDSATDSNVSKQREPDNKDTTLSDISSHSSGFSSTEGHSDTNRNAKHMTHSAVDYEHSSEIINSLQTLNTEIRDIWQVLNSQQQMNVAKVIPIGQLLYTDVGWQLPIAASNIPNIQNLPNSVSINVPAINVSPDNISLAKDRLQYRPIGNTTAKTAQVVPGPGGVATSLVERTRDLRDWLKQQAAL